MALSPKELLDRIASAEKGTVVYAGDIDFTPEPGVLNAFARIALKKSVTIESGYPNRNAVFTCAGFDITGPKVPGETLECAFVNITFDGGVSAAELTDGDWTIPLKPDGTPRYDEPVKAQYAVSFGGNVSVTFTGCTFESYMYETGPAMRAFYGDYTGNPGLSATFEDYSSCKLNVRLSDCTFTENAALYGGGAVYLDGNGNVTLLAENCAFSKNVSGAGEYSEGGGALRFGDINAVFSGCTFSGNTANRCYIEDRVDDYRNLYVETDGECDIPYTFLTETDRTQGGAIFSMGGELTVSDSVFEGNRASLGGAVRLQNTDAQIGGCTFRGNSASPSAMNPWDETGPWSAMGMGGALYINSEPDSPVRIYECDIYGNTAEYAYGALYAYYSDSYKNLMPLGFGSVNLYSCTIRENICETVYDYTADIVPWASHPGDILEIEYLKMHGCIFTDAVYEKDFPRSEEPSPENDYCYIASTGEGPERITVPSAVKTAWNENRKAVSVSKEMNGTGRIILPVGLAVLLTLLFVFLWGKRKKKPAFSENAFTAEEIASLRENVVLRQILTGRELDVMCEYVSGTTRSKLAEKLFISEATAKTHISNIYSKLEVGNRTELIRKLKDL